MSPEGVSPRPLRAAPAARPERRPPLEVVGPRRRRSRRRLAPIVSAALVTGSLLVVVAGHSLLDQDQIRISSLQAAISAAQATHRQEQLSVAGLENPAQIVGKAETTLHMVAPTSVTQLPHVSLDAPLPGSTASSTTTTAPAPTGQ